MKKNFLLSLIGGLVLLLSITDVKAKCTYSEQASLNNEVANVKVRYETLQETEEDSGGCDGGGECSPVYYPYINVNVMNLSKNFYVTITDSVTGKTNKYYYDDIPADGILKIRWDDVSKINTFTVNVYSSEETSCPDTRLKVTHITTPRWNEYADFAICEDVPDYYLCQRYVTYEKDPSYGEFVEKIEDEKKVQEEREKEKEKGFWDKIKEFLSKNKVFIIVGTVVVIIGIAGCTIIIRKKREL